MQLGDVLDDKIDDSLFQELENESSETDATNHDDQYSVIPSVLISQSVSEFEHVSVRDIEVVDVPNNPGSKVIIVKLRKFENF